MLRLTDKGKFKTIFFCNSNPDPTAVRFQDRELQLFDGTRLMSAAKFEDLKAAEGLTEAQLEARGVRKIHPAFREGSSLNK